MRWKVRYGYASSGIILQSLHNVCIAYYCVLPRILSVFCLRVKVRLQAWQYDMQCIQRVFNAEVSMMRSAVAA